MFLTGLGGGHEKGVDKALRAIEEWLAAEPFPAPEADELAELKLGPRELAAALLEQLDARRVTRRGDDGTRVVV